MERDEAMSFMLKSLKILLHKEGSDLFITAGFPPAIKIKGTMTPISQQPLSANHAQSLTQCIMNDKQLKEFEETQECNFAISPANLCRFRVNAYVQQGCQGLVLRVIPAEIPNFEKLGLPSVLKEIISHKNGLIIMVGGTGSGKSTSMAAMIDHRNETSYGHIITIEDPIEFVHKHKNCIMMQREVGVDTKGWEIALHNTLRQAPDVIVLGEIRDAEIMNFGMEFAQTGHLAMATLHANNSNQAVDRILGFFPIESQEKLKQDISLNLRAIISQRLVKTVDGGRCAAIEILINTPLIADLIAKGDISGIKPIMAKSRELGMQTFDQALLDLYQSGKISYSDALKNADSRNELRLQIKLASGENKQTGSLSLQETDDDDNSSTLKNHD
ncbi:MAG: PilT/PilU family type 4a pilus ATPase [Gammaproteobacteria bacterium]|jgi:twitching motility protein PilU|nr:PilT/PilU family type 4a pilus ATPase [Gammaproteobacteria bacterium]MBT5221961.1 PilT/PilU family type 4a pilus ATPase [Gammaproteobacteria bacterium]MBT5966226.1 PilT/PilU family type 4a pilus ATPase [Gammaproteobacteria bacterium]MBT6418865.1 PilT/PilU family type 4a pilus ATPase [Gammaproteobacteria bacterium]MBT6575829.1 PilT/PilU family type 4a pilus ATPase [Gammaproteobacteria bacterium]